MTDAVTAADRRVLQNGLLGPLTVPDGLGNPGGVEDLCRRQLSNRLG